MVSELEGAEDSAGEREAEEERNVGFGGVARAPQKLTKGGHGGEGGSAGALNPLAGP